MFNVVRLALGNEGETALWHHDVSWFERFVVHREQELSPRLEPVNKDAEPLVEGCAG